MHSSYVIPATAGIQTFLLSYRGLTTVSKKTTSISCFNIFTGSRNQVVV
ncbi:hypothetical protein [Rickettsia endosymbiont of Ixodes pacificus]